MKNRPKFKTRNIISFLGLIALLSAIAVRGIFREELIIENFQDFWKVYYHSMGYGLSVIAITFALLYFQNSYRGIFTWRELGWKNILIALPAGIVLTLLGNVLVGIFSEFFWNEPQNTEHPVVPYITKAAYIPFWILLSIVKGGLAEEFLRVSALRIFKRNFGKWGFWIAIVLVSLVFSLDSYNSGWQKMAEFFTINMLFGLFYVWKPSLCLMVIAHSTRDIVTVLLAYFLL